VVSKGIYYHFPEYASLTDEGFAVPSFQDILLLALNRPEELEE
jgi:hypothetical protein